MSPRLSQESRKRIAEAAKTHYIGDLNDGEVRVLARQQMHVSANTRYVTCAVHGARGLIEDVFALNNWCLTEDGLCCDPSHPYCFRSMNTLPPTETPR